MKFLICYECRTGNGLFSGQVEFESAQEPTTTDQAVIEAALKDSVRFHASGAGGLSITSVSLVAH
ncbi:hypothetical protein F970_02555 [Acinetobacter sp. CIP 102082]|uniref:Uncharacterized protein n=1 Tax=Acinetobacter parvus DSM 16617 = CIP 108168 TaxID=981333 RepID=N8QDN9_9GAMM|nr:hypothetical protein F988_01268 [Acinetobacter parvus DSM 16617 = CIP 108168]ENU84340.1 hypothetical protein F974_00529 [Acinetobacter sp. CIP 102159]ENU89829.1 hypothetical protein F972_00869 [Acinetobacter sp. CIP 102529]ENU94775.1 hypothetical protein F970_02555 [Acinetobacter sp. CIP 102082]ENX66390.1 hypothetical protein F884_01052 [Acinetobacter sp. CIP 102143]